MATKKKVEAKERAAVGRERRLALALAGVGDAAGVVSSEVNPELNMALALAYELLNELGYSGIESTAKRLSRINQELTQAIADGDGARISELGKELEKAKAGKFHRVTTEAPAE